ncbi:MAG: hypothetical protein NTY01_17205 [Verrucomicrobia bacterium]|nr:hypothetical protein [Verrucomicrobiota bacterium]
MKMDVIIRRSWLHSVLVLTYAVWSLVELLGAEAKISETFSVSYKSSGGLGVHPSELRISPAGDVTVWVYVNQKRLPYVTRLNEEERTALASLIDSSGFYSQPERVKGEYPPDIGETELEISGAAKSKRLRYGLRESMGHLTGWLYGLIWQARVLLEMKTLKTPASISAVRSGVCPQCSGGKVLQYRAIVDPVKEILKEILAANRDLHALYDGLGALLHVVSPNDFCRYVETLLKQSDRERRSIISEAATKAAECKDARATLQVLFPVLLFELNQQVAPLIRPENQNWSEQARFDSGYWYAFHTLVENRYEPVVPFIAKIVENHRVSPDMVNAELHTAFYGFDYLVSMGPAALPQITRMMDSPEVKTRIHGTKLLLMSWNIKTSSAFRKYVTQADVDETRKSVKSQGLPILRRLASDDTNQEVRKSARRVLATIEKEMMSPPATAR